MNIKVYMNRFLLICVTVLLLLLAWEALSGGIDQYPRSKTMGQQVETIIQLALGVFCILTVLTIFWWQEWAKPVRVAWAITLVAVVVLSSLVWGPFMPITTLVLTALALLIALAVIWALKHLSDR